MLTINCYGLNGDYLFSQKLLFQNLSFLLVTNKRGISYFSKSKLGNRIISSFLAVAAADYDIISGLEARVLLKSTMKSSSLQFVLNK